MTRSWSDWAGFIFSLAFADLVLAQTSLISIQLVPTILHEVLVAASFLIRRTPRARSMQWNHRAISYCASFILPLFTMCFQQVRPQWLVETTNPFLRNAGFALWGLGSVFGLWAIWCLRRSFSIEPQARELVRSGPYRIARHPIYTSYILQYFGILLGHLTVPLAAICVVWFVLMFVRAHIEESVLDGAFAEYAAYRQRVGMFGPRLIRWANAAREQSLPPCRELDEALALVPYKEGE